MKIERFPTDQAQDYKRSKTCIILLEAKKVLEANRYGSPPVGAKIFLEANLKSFDGIRYKIEPSKWEQIWKKVDYDSVTSKALPSCEKVIIQQIQVLFSLSSLIFYGNGLLEVRDSRFSYF